ncbi:MAG: hypothetical protein HC825_05205, partial [Oscillatoriales cyanobacterium RM1_1_9]|nr:hypothetical protein [Oscillatoriales cyanobacterium RM1_1_9]
MGEATRLLLYQLNSATFVEFLEKLLTKRTILEVLEAVAVPRDVGGM